MKNKNKYKKYVEKKEPSFSIFLDKIFKFLSHKIYFMFVPHSNKKTKSISIPIYALIILIVIVLSSMMSAFVILTENTVLASKTKILQGSHEEQLEEIKNLEITAKRIIEADGSMTSLTNILKRGGIKTSDIFVNTNTNTGIVEQIENKAKELEKSKELINQLNSRITARTKTMNSIPSILPVTGQNVIISRPFQEGILLPKSIEIETISGTDVRATATGKISKIKFIKNKGFEVTIEHAFALKTKYMGLATINYTVGKTIEKGNTIGKSRHSAFEYEVQVASQFVDPILITSFNYE